MSGILSDPFVQSAVLPFGIALLGGALTSRLLPAWTGVTVMVAFFIAAILIAGWQFSPLTSTRKIILLGAVALAAGILLDVLPLDKRTTYAVLSGLAVAAVLWVLWPVLSRRTGASLWWPALGAMAYAGWCVVAFHHLRDRALPLVSGLLALAAASGIAATVAATALLGQLVSTIAAACGALWLLLVFADLRVGAKLSFPAALLCALFALAAVFYARLPWASLAWLALVPALSLLPVPVPIRWQQAIYYVSVAILPAGMAVYQAWRSAGDIVF